MPISPTLPPTRALTIRAVVGLVLSLALLAGLVSGHSAVRASTDDWGLVWSDEFDGTKLDTSIWRPYHNTYGDGNRELQCYTPNNVSVSNGTLKLTSKRETVTCPNGSTRQFSSAFLGTRENGVYFPRFGRYEVRAKLPHGQGLWPAFWLRHRDGSPTAEIDVMEYFHSQVPGKTSATLHLDQRYNVSKRTVDFEPPTTTPGWHTWAVDIDQVTDGVRFTFFLDGKAFHTYTDTQANWATRHAGKPLFDIALNVAVGGDWIGHPDTHLGYLDLLDRCAKWNDPGPAPDRCNKDGILRAQFPNTMEVDYVRVFERGATAPVTEPPPVEEPVTDPDPEPDVRQGVTSPTEPIARGSTWRWRFEHGDWPTGWNEVGYDDRAWNAAPAALGFGSDGLGTDIDTYSDTSERPISAQFRRNFEVTDLSSVEHVDLTTVADDGVVVYVNGTEVGRANMPDGDLHSRSYPTIAPRTSTAAANPITFTVPTSLLREGTNVVAVSTHLSWRATPDISFDLNLSARVRTEAPATDDPPADDPPTDDPAAEEPDPHETLVGEDLVSRGATWRWRYENGSWPSDWTSIGFDGGWRSGSATLGFGTAGLATDIGYSKNNPPPSAQFRRTFTVADASRLREVTVTTVADDGVVVYVNGTEVGRANLPNGDLTARTSATAAPTTAVARSVTFTVPVDLLRDGTNVVAASTHLAKRTADISFDLRLHAVRAAS